MTLPRGTPPVVTVGTEAGSVTVAAAPSPTIAPLDKPSEAKTYTHDQLSRDKSALKQVGFLEGGDPEHHVSLTLHDEEKLYGYLQKYVGTLDRLRDLSKLSQHELDMLDGYKLVLQKLDGRKKAIDGMKNQGLGFREKPMNIFENENQITLALGALEEIRRYEAAALAIEIINNPGFKPEVYKPDPGRPLRPFTPPHPPTQLLHVPTGQLQYGGLVGVLNGIGAVITRYELNDFVEIEFKDLGAANRLLTDFTEQTGFVGTTPLQLRQDLGAIESLRQELYSKLTHKNRTSREFRSLVQDFDETYEVRPAPGGTEVRDLSKGRNRLKLHNLIAAQLDELMKRETAPTKFMDLSREKRFQLRTEAARSVAIKLLKREKVELIKTKREKIADVAKNLFQNSLFCMFSLR